MTEGEKAQLASQGTAIFAALDKGTRGRHVDGHVRYDFIRMLMISPAQSTCSDRAD
jgi:hypothetical protein